MIEKSSAKVTPINFMALQQRLSDTQIRTSNILLITFSIRKVYSQKRNHTDPCLCIFKLVQFSTLPFTSSRTHGV